MFVDFADRFPKEQKGILKSRINVAFFRNPCFVVALRWLSEERPCVADYHYFAIKVAMVRAELVIGSMVYLIMSRSRRFMFSITLHF